MSGSVCFEEELPEEHIIPAAQRAIELNPKNAPNGHTSGVRMTQRLALMTSKKWPSPVRLKVEFMEQTSPQLRTRIVGHMNAWSQYCDVEFREDMKNAQATVRITLLGKEYKSAVGTDIKTRNPKNPTMWLGGFTMNTLESEYRRVVRHETGHTLGFRHEHLRKDIVKWIDKDKAYAYYGSGPNGWDKPKIDANVLTGIDEKVLTATKEVDGDSIMCYFIGDLLTAKAPHFVGGRDISPKDAKLAREVYPMYVFHEIAFHDSGAIDVASYYNQVYIHKRDGTVWSWDGDSDGDGKSLFSLDLVFVLTTISQDPENGHALTMKGARYTLLQPKIGFIKSARMGKFGYMITALMVSSRPTSACSPSIHPASFRMDRYNRWSGC